MSEPGGFEDINLGGTEALGILSVTTGLRLRRERAVAGGRGVSNYLV